MASAQPAGRALTTQDFAGGGFSTLFRDSVVNKDGLREVKSHLAFPPMAGYPAIFVSVTQVELQTKSGQLGYTVDAGQPTCTKPGTAEMTCNGFDLTITEGKGTHISLMNVEWFALNTVGDLRVFGTSKLTLLPQH